MKKDKLKRFVGVFIILILRISLHYGITMTRTYNFQTRRRDRLQ